MRSTHMQVMFDSSGVEREKQIGRGASIFGGYPPAAEEPNSTRQIDRVADVRTAYVRRPIKQVQKMRERMRTDFENNVFRPPQHPRVERPAGQLA